MLRFNENNEVITEERYSAILVGLMTGPETERSMDELEGLAQAAGVTALAQMTQSAERPSTATYIGRGKIEELGQAVKNMEADTVIFNNELTGMQIRNIEEAVGVRVIDRTILILDIFASRAVSREGKLQVELAQLRYRLPRLTGFGKSLSRLGGGIGTRGPGEKKLETDRRHIERRINDIKAELAHVKRTRSVQRSRRVKNEVPVVALVGYTNAGKSALMNRILSMTCRSGRDSKGVLEKDMLFATLDTHQRSIEPEKGKKFILTDTVGFVSGLPHALIEAFKSTLEEVAYADLILHVVDASYDDHDFHMRITDRVLDEIGAGGREKITVFNKIDLPHTDIFSAAWEDSVEVSAKSGENMDILLEMIQEKLFGRQIHVNLLVPYDRGDVVSYLIRETSVLKTEYREDGTYIEALVQSGDRERFRKYETVQDGI